MEYIISLPTLLFLLTSALAIFLFRRASNNSGTVPGILLVWLIIQGILGFSGFFTRPKSIPPGIFWLLFPPVLSIIILFATPGGRRFIDRLNPGWLTLLHIVRFPVEMVLYLLFLQHLVPKIMTFAGGNYDILSGISAPFIYYFGYIKKTLSRTFLLWWNVICLGLLFNIIVRAILSTPSPFQRLAFDQPNLAILHFPYNWLPSVIVPLVLFSHLSCIRFLMRTVPYQKRTVTHKRIL